MRDFQADQGTLATDLDIDGLFETRFFDALDTDADDD